jgi:hypothetical protein
MSSMIKTEIRGRIMDHVAGQVFALAGQVAEETSASDIWSSVGEMDGRLRE